MDTSSMGCKKMILETNPHNPRTISKDSYEKLKASIERNPDGLTANKIAYKDGIIISGNQRYRALTELGLEHKKEWFKDLSGWTQEQIDEWIIQSNISAGEWDWDILANEWEQTDLEEWGVDIPQQIDDDDKPEPEALYQFRIEVICDNEEQQETLFNKLKGEGFDCRLLTL